jgi:hypothetical protein
VSLAGDVACTVTVSGISGGGPTSRTYTVTLFNPDELGEQIEISGPSDLSLAGATYTFNSIEQSDEYELEVARLDGEAWLDGAEDDPLPRIEEAVSPGYDLRQSALKRTGMKAFQLTYPSGVFADQSFVIARDLIPAAESRLKFHERARFSTENTTLEAQISEDGGVSWFTVFSRSGVGGNSGLWDSSWIAREIDLSSYAGEVINLRFRMTRNGGSIYQGVSDNYGFFIDDITLTGGVQLTFPNRTVLPKYSSSFALDTNTAGGPLQSNTQYAMRIRPNVGCRWFDNGPLKIVRTAVLASPEIAVEHPSGTGLVDGMSTVAYGNVTVGVPASRTFVIRNSGTANLSGITVTKIGTNAADFTVTSNPAVGIAPGSATKFFVKFAPTTAGVKSATIRIASNDADENPFDIKLSGLAFMPEIAVEQPSGTGLVDGVSTVAYGNVTVGVPASRTFVIRNTGISNLIGITVTKIGTNAADFTVTSNPAVGIAPGSATKFFVKFAPTTAGVKSATIRIASNDANENPFDIKLTGSAFSVP